MAQQQKQRGPLGPSAESDSSAGVKRQAPASDTLLKELDTAAREVSGQEQFEKRKRIILERCGCL